MIGAAISTGLSMTLTSGLIMNWYYLKKTKLDIIKFWKESTGIIVTAALMAVLALWVKQHMIYERMEILQLGLGIALFVLIYAGIIYQFVMNTQEKEQLLAFVKRK